ncbi:MAG: CRISPR-associated helicase Cas3' [Aggregatilineales bacterium]
MTDPILSQFWGKTPATGAATDRFHPAMHHMIDVGCVAEALLRDGPPRLRHALSHAWKGTNPELFLGWLPFLIATHDLGKISAAFQGQVSSQRERLVALSVPFPPKKGPDLYHAEVSAVWLHNYLGKREPGVSSRLIQALRDAMGGHHGRFADRTATELEGVLRETEGGRANRLAWDGWRDSVYTLLRNLFAPPGALHEVGFPDQLRAASIALTGFIIWCDWMGSNQNDFPACPDQTPEDYIYESRQRARAALSLNHLDRHRPSPIYNGYESLFKEPARPLQAVIDTLPAEQLRGPILLIIEAPTGEGKTEAALAIARRIAAENGTDEIFFALPTMASGNQMFTRLQSFYDRLYGEPGAVKLTHSQALIIEEELRRAVLTNDSDSADPAGLSGPAALHWFGGDKKAILAPFGVGTVDQVELAGLNVRHYMLRLFGFAKKVVVIDEVHAYDAYMNTILDHTLEWLAALGSSVILLSATLPSERHHRLAVSYQKGLGVATTGVDSEALPYPVLSLYRADGRTHYSSAVFRPDQHFMLRVAAQRDPVDEASHLIELVQDGGAVARICNRVDDAQSLFRAVMSRVSESHRRILVLLLHARFPLEDRARREEQIKSTLGKDTRRSTDQAVILIGTQVLEQSLDYDVDVMVTDFAPVDLLLQRAGRLHRHDRTRPKRHTRALLEVILPFAEDGIPTWPRWERIYAPYILARTWDALFPTTGRDREIILPHDYRLLIEAVYAEADQAPDERHERHHRAQKAYDIALQAMNAKAREVLTPPVNSRDPITAGNARPFNEEDAPDVRGQLAKTRLGDRVTLVPIYGKGTAWALDVRLTNPISNDVPPPLSHRNQMSQKDILARAIPVSDPKIVAAYRDDQRPDSQCWPWKEVPSLLDSVYPLLLDSQHSALIDGRKLTLDKNLGLIIEREEQ